MIHSLPWIAIFFVTLEAIRQWFSLVTSSLRKIIAELPHSWQRIVIYSNSCVILYLFSCRLRPHGPIQQGTSSTIGAKKWRHVSSPFLFYTSKLIIFFILDTMKLNGPWADKKRVGLAKLLYIAMCNTFIIKISGSIANPSMIQLKPLSFHISRCHR